MVKYKKKIVFGMKNIHIAKIEGDGSFATPVPILGAKNVEASFDVSEKSIYADNMEVYKDVRVTGGSGKLGVLSLSIDEKCLLAGTESLSGGFLLSNEVSKPVALLFEQDKADGGKLFNVLYNVTFSAEDLKAVTTEKEIDEKITDLSFYCSSMYFEDIQKTGYYYVVDSNHYDTDEEMIRNWYTTVQKPKANSVLGHSKTKKIDNPKKSDN